MVRWRWMSRTDTDPERTVVRVPRHVSVVTQNVPRTVATLFFPCVRKRPPLSRPQSWRLGGLRLATAAARALPPAELQLTAGPRRKMSVMPPDFTDWRTSKTPLWNVAVCVRPPVRAVVSAIVPDRVSSTAPTGIAAPAVSVVKPAAPGAFTRTVPATGATTTVLPSAGTGAAPAEAATGATGSGAGAGAAGAATGAAAGAGAVVKVWSA